MSHEQPLYISKPHYHSWGQEYRIYHDRIELRAKILFCTLHIPLDQIIEIVVRPKGLVWADLYRRPMEFWWSYNNDRGGPRYVYLRRKGWPPQIRFTPEDPDAFVAKCNELRANGPSNN